MSEAGQQTSVAEWPDAPVAFVHRSSVFGGAEESLLSNASDLRLRGARVVILCLEEGDAATRIAETDIPTVRLDARGSPHGTSTGWSRVRASLEYRSKNLESAWGLALHRMLMRREVQALAGALKDLKPGVLVGNMTAVADYSFLQTAKTHGIRTLSHQRMTPEAGTGGRVARECNRVCDQFVSNSRWTREHWIRHGLRAARHDVIYNRIEVEPGEISPLHLREALGLGGDAKIVASVGRLVSWKRFDLGLAAFAAVATQHSRWHWVVFGDGPERAALENAACEHGLSGRVHLLGEIRHAARCLSEVDLLLHPTPGEHFGRCVAEAMLRGVVVVGHSSGGMLEMIDDTKNGFLGTDTASMAEALRNGFKHHDERVLKEGARARIEALCGSENSARLAELLRTLLVLRPASLVE